ncbi:MAG TPA: energy transducer TonB [Candidatus Acidoferrales bacterium]
MRPQPEWWGARQAPKSQPVWVQVPANVAAAHLLKKVKPQYPAFAKAAGIEETVSVDVRIFPDGRVHGIARPPAGWACLSEAAMNAAEQYVYRPFTKDGQAVYVETTEDIVFKLPRQHSVFDAPPPPKLDLSSFTPFYRHQTQVADGPPEIFKWFLSQLRQDSDYLDWAKRGAFDGIKDGLPANRVEVPTGTPSSRLYLVVDNAVRPSVGTRVLCSNNGSCDVWVVEDNAGIVRLGITTGGFGFYARQRKGAAYPDLFFPWGMGASETDVDGYVNIGGYWGLLYCGSVEQGIHVCRN